MLYFFVYMTLYSFKEEQCLYYIKEDTQEIWGTCIIGKSSSQIKYIQISVSVLTVWHLWMEIIIVSTLGSLGEKSEIMHAKFLAKIWLRINILLMLTVITIIIVIIFNVMTTKCQSFWTYVILIINHIYRFNYTILINWELEKVFNYYAYLSPLFRNSANTLCLNILTGIGLIVSIKHKQSSLSYFMFH